MLKKSLMPLLVSLALLSGCAELTQPSKEDISASIKESLAKQVGKEVTDVSLMRESDHTLKGIATYANGDTAELEVTVDGEQFMWKVVSPFAR